MSEREPLFSSKNMKLLRDPLNDSNPITVQVLGICSALAVTVKLENSVARSISRGVHGAVTYGLFDVSDRSATRPRRWVRHYGAKHDT